MGDFLKAFEVPSSVSDQVSETEMANAIKMAEGAIRTYCEWHISEQTVTAQVVEEPVGHHIFLPTLHLTAVSAVVEDGTALTVGTGYRWKAHGELTRVGRCWSTEWEGVTWSGTHGYAKGSPEMLAVKQVALAVVARLLDTPNERATGYQAGMISESFAAPPQVPSGLLYSEQGSLAPFKLPVVG